MVIWIWNYIDTVLQLIYRVQRKLANLLSYLFIVIYYRDVIVIGSLVFVIVIDGLSAGSIVMIVSILTFFAECYWWCRLAEFYKEAVRWNVVFDYDTC